MTTTLSSLPVCGLVLFGCSKSDNPADASSAQGDIKISLVDSPAGFDAVNIVVSTVAGTDTLSAATDSVSVAIKLMAVPAGTYSIMFVPTVTSYRDTTITGVQVIAQQDKSLGAITLKPL